MLSPLERVWIELNDLKMVISISVTEALWMLCSCGREQIMQRWEKVMENVGLIYIASRFFIIIKKKLQKINQQELSHRSNINIKNLYLLNKDLFFLIYFIYLLVSSLLYCIYILSWKMAFLHLFGDYLFIAINIITCFSGRIGKTLARDSRREISNSKIYFLQ